MSSVLLWGERAFMASWELGQGQIPSLGERVEHRGLLYRDYHYAFSIIIIIFLSLLTSQAEGITTMLFIYGRYYEEDLCREDWKQH